MAAPLSPSDSLELESLASSGSSRAGSTRNDNDNDSLISSGNMSRRSSLNDEDFSYYNEEADDDDVRNQLLSVPQGARRGRHGRSQSSVSSISDLVFALPASRDLLTEIEIPLEKQKQLTWFDGLSLVIGMQVGYVFFFFCVFACFDFFTLIHTRTTPYSNI